VTDRGLRHYRNEDAMALAATETPRGTVLIAIVCDGVSGSTRADEASAAAAEAAIRVLIPAVRAGQDAAEASLQAVQAAQAAVAGLVGPPGQTAPQDAPSATFVSAVVSAESVTVCSLGDSRAYWLDATATSAAKQLSTDDSVVAQLVTAGLLSEAAALDAPQADVSGTELHIATFAPPGPGVVLLCSDGLWNYEPEAARLAARVLPAALTGPLAAARTLTDFALQAGGHDNITVVLAPLPLLRSADDPVPFSGDVPAEGSPPTRGQGDDDE
jgi:serine/threonine protein phosphatase PrpC